MAIKTLFLSILSTFVDSINVFDCRLPGVIKIVCGFCVRTGDNPHLSCVLPCLSQKPSAQFEVISPGTLFNVLEQDTLPIQSMNTGNRPK